MIERALVLGGGGPVGIAWEAGVLAGLASEGVDLSAADLVIGTSAGSFVGSLIAGGTPPRAVYDSQIEAPPAPPPAGQNGGVSPLFALMAKAPRDTAPGPDHLREIGAFALGAQTMSEADFITVIAPARGANQSWPPRFRCTAIDAESGEFKLWQAEDGVDLVAAIASSCAVPGIFPPITINGRRYMDGGMRTMANIDQAAGAKRILALAVVPAAFAPFMMPTVEREEAVLRAAGGEPLVIAPDADASAAFGPNLMDASRRAPVAQAGFAQGQREAARVKAFWS